MSMNPDRVLAADRRKADPERIEGGGLDAESVP